MKDSKGIDPKNLTAQLHYHGIGNPPVSHPSTAISNSFPGLEADFRNIWVHIFEGIILHEASNLVVDVESGTDEKIKQLVSSDVQYFLVMAHGHSMVGRVKGPSSHDHSVSINTTMPLEWSNALAEIIPLAGQYVRCKFESGDQRRKPIWLKLKVRHFFDADFDIRGKITNQRAVISREMAFPGELTQSLCSPWQNDYRECGCFYWAASRPDFVNVQSGKDGKSEGNNWMQKDRTNFGEKKYISDSDDEGTKKPVLINYQDLFIAWEENLRFIIAGKDESLKKSAKEIKTAGKKKAK